jgi:4-diphosphocytidyl-2-C-methyl-D-erythritol kinase
LVIKSFAKVNLYLEVINKRRDNFHSLNTLFERISLYDKITLSIRNDNLIKISCNDAQVPLGQKNLCWRAAKLIKDSYKINKGLNIRIVKNIPVGAGLGGGSSNAAAVLLGLNKLWKLNLSRIRLSALAARLGSDVSFFVFERPFASGCGRGEKIRILNSLNKIKLNHILVVPRIHVSTPLIFNKFDGFTGLTKPAYNVKILTSELSKNGRIQDPDLLYNSLESVTLRLYPEVKRIKEKLINLGFNSVLMSGSGPAVFALLPPGTRAATLRNKLKKQKKEWRVFAVSTAL